MSAALAAPYLRSTASTSPGQEPPGIRRKERGGPNPPAQNVDESYVGHGPIVGVQITTFNAPRPLPPDPAEEAGIGRAPTMRWAHLEEDLHTFDKFYMGVGVRHPEPHEAELSLHTNQPFHAEQEAEFGGQHEGANPPITAYNEGVTIPAREARSTLTRRRRG